VPSASDSLCALFSVFFIRILVHLLCPWGGKQLAQRVAMTSTKFMSSLITWLITLHFKDPNSQTCLFSPSLAAGIMPCTTANSACCRKWGPGPGEVQQSWPSSWLAMWQMVQPLCASVFLSIKRDGYSICLIGLVSRICENNGWPMLSLVLCTRAVLNHYELLVWYHHHHYSHCHLYQPGFNHRNRTSSK
jgi:hypothetical protein